MNKNEMGTEKIPTLLIKYSIPAIIGILLTVCLSVMLQNLVPLVLQESQ